MPRLLNHLRALLLHICRLVDLPAHVIGAAASSKQVGRTHYIFRQSSFPYLLKYQLPLTISVLHAWRSVTTEYGIPSDFVRNRLGHFKSKFQQYNLIFRIGTY